MVVILLITKIFFLLMMIIMTKKLGDEGPELRWEYSLADKFQENYGRRHNEP